MRKVEPVSAYEYEVLENQHLITYNYLPTGPLTLLYGKESYTAAYYDYDQRFKIEVLPAPEAGLVCITIPEANEYWQILRLLSVLNTVNQPITFYCSPGCIETTSRFANANITMRPLDLREELVVKASLVITYSLSAVYFLQQKVPVIIIGPYGFGGWVNVENFSYHQQFGFSGRPGGQLWESLSEVVMEDELRYLSANDISVQVEEVYQRALELPFIPVSNLGEIRAYYSRLLSRFKDVEERWDLIPRKSDLVQFKTIFSKYQIYICREGLNDTIAVTEDASFFTFIDGKNTFRDILNQSGLEENEFWDIIQELHQTQIIVL